MELIEELSQWLLACTGYDKISLQPNAGSQGEFAGLLAIKRYHESNQDHQRKICLIPASAHGTNAASAIMAGLQVVVIECDDLGDIDIEDLRIKASKHKENLAGIMVTYPSTHGVFEEGIVQICDIVHEAGGQVYVDGANLNALVGLAAPGDFGADVSHLNLHNREGSAIKLNLLSQLIEGELIRGIAPQRTEFGWLKQPLVHFNATH